MNMLGLPDFVLPAGAKGCIMQWVTVLSHQVQLGQPWGSITDQPECANPVITAAAIRINDRLDDVDRQRLWLLLPRLNEARRTSADRRVNVRLAIWCAESVFEMVKGKDRRAKARKAIEAAKAWLDNPAAAAANVDPVDWLIRLLDAHEKACADEGVLHELEDAACYIGSQWGRIVT